MIAVFEKVWIFSVLAFVTVFLEFSLPLALWFRRTRPFAILVETGFHLQIALFMEIRVFSYAVIGSYLLFLEPETLNKAVSRLCPRRSDDVAG